MAKSSSKANETVLPVPILSDKDRTNRMIANAYNLAEQRIEDGTASSQLLLYFLKLGDESREAELEKLRCENQLLQEKIETIRQSRANETAYTDVIKAMRMYSGNDGV